MTSGRGTTDVGSVCLADWAPSTCTGGGTFCPSGGSVEAGDASLGAKVTETAPEATPTGSRLCAMGGAIGSPLEGGATGSLTGAGEGDTGAGPTVTVDGAGADGVGVLTDGGAVTRAGRSMIGST